MCVCVREQPVRSQDLASIFRCCSCNCMCGVAWRCSALTRALHSATTETNDCFCAYGGDAPALTPYNLQWVSLQYPSTSVVTPCSATTETNNCLCAFGGDAPALAPFNVQYVSLQYLPTSVITPCSALTRDLCISDNAVCLCVCVRA